MARKSSRLSNQVELGSSLRQRKGKRMETNERARRIATFPSQTQVVSDRTIPSLSTLRIRPRRAEIPLKPSPVVLAGGSVQSMVTKGSLTENPDVPLIAGVIGGTLGSLVVLMAIFYFLHRIRRWSKSRNANVEKEETEEGHPRQSLHASTTPSRPVSVFSDTTVDSDEKRGNFRSKLGIKGEAGKGSKVPRGVNRHTLTRYEEKTEEGSELVDRLEQLSESQSSPSTSSPSSYHTTSLPSPVTSSYYHHDHVNVSQGRREGGGGIRNQAQAQFVFPSPSHVATRSAGGYAAAIQRAGVARQ